MDYYSTGWRSNADGQGQAYRDATTLDSEPETIICSECGAELPLDCYTARFGRCAKHADGE